MAPGQTVYELGSSKCVNTGLFGVTAVVNLSQSSGALGQLLRGTTTEQQRDRLTAIGQTCEFPRELGSGVHQAERLTV